MGLLLVERVMRSRHANGAPRMASSVNGHWLGALSNCEQPPSLWNYADQLTIKALPAFAGEARSANVVILNQIFRSHESGESSRNVIRHVDQE